MDKRDFRLDFKIAKQKALHEWTLGLISEVMLDTDRKRTPKEKYETIKDIVLEAISEEEEF